MKYSSLIFICISIVACSNGPDEVLVVENQILSSIEHKTLDNDWTETFNYDAEDRLISIDDSFGGGVRKEFVYAGDKVVRINHNELTTNTLNNIDSLTYNNDGNLTSFQVLNAYPGPGPSPAWTYEFDYDNNQKVSKQSTFFDRTGNYSGYITYEWSGENISKMNHFDIEGELLYEYFYEFDDKINFAKGILTYLEEPMYWNKNNITKFEYIDHTGLLDLACGPCTYEYEYDEADYPTEIEHNWGWVLKLNYN